MPQGWLPIKSIKDICVKSKQNYSWYHSNQNPELFWSQSWKSPVYFIFLNLSQTIPFSSSKYPPSLVLTDGIKSLLQEFPSPLNLEECFCSKSLFPHCFLFFCVHLAQQMKSDTQHHLLMSSFLTINSSNANSLASPFLCASYFVQNDPDKLWLRCSAKCITWFPQPKFRPSF